ncbi:MAG: hypothetical protein ACI9E1_001704 [Cryomorphaceae bacterium]|jgi:hypothetical protein
MNTYIKLSLTAALSLGCISISSATSRPDAHAPIGIMGDHTHSAGEWMVSYRHMHMQMNDLYQGSGKVGANLADSGYMMTPREMTMDMDMLGIMYAPTDQLTLMLMTSYKQNEMTMNNAAGVEAMTMKSDGMGDTILTAMYQFHKTAHSNAHFGLGISIPTGATDKKVTSAPMPPAIGRDLPYPMQLGSGTVDFTPSVTYNHFIDQDWSWGAQLKTTLHTSENDEGYTFGDSLNFTSWASRNVNQNFSVNARINAKVWSGIDGTQANGLHTLNPVLSSPADPASSGGTKLDAYMGVNYVSVCGVRAALEVGKTFWQDLEGTQLGSDWSLNVGLQFAW